MTNIYNWSATPADNDDADGNLWSEGQAANTVNNSARDNMASVARFWRDGSTLTATGAANAYAVTTNTTFTALVDGMRLGFIANHDNTGAATLAVDGLTAKPLQAPTNTENSGADDLAALVADEIKNGQYVECVYKSTPDAFVITSNLTGTRYAPATHTHAIGDVTGLQTAIDGKLNLTGGTLTGGLTGTTGTFSGAVSTGALSVTGAMTATTTITATGALSGASVVAGANQSLSIVSSNARWTVDSGSDYLEYNRAANRFDFVIGGSTVSSITSGTQRVVKYVVYEDAGWQSFTDDVPFDYTAPSLAGEGFSVFSESYTPISLTNRIVVRAKGNVTADAAQSMIAYLIVYPSTSADDVAVAYVGGADQIEPVVLMHTVSPMTGPSPILINVRVGTTDGTNTVIGYINGTTASRAFGGKLRWTLEVIEIEG